MSHHPSIRRRLYRIEDDIFVSGGNTVAVLGLSKWYWLEGKGKDDAKATATWRWVEAVNTWGRLRIWHHSIGNKEAEVTETIERVRTTANRVPVDHRFGLA